MFLKLHFKWEETLSGRTTLKGGSSVFAQIPQNKKIYGIKIKLKLNMQQHEMD
jgi:hypothetical protein